MATESTVRGRINKNLKQQATAVLPGMGLTVSDAVRILLIRIAREKALPFDITPKAIITETLLKSTRSGDLHYAKDADALFKKLDMSGVSLPILAGSNGTSNWLRSAGRIWTSSRSRSAF